MGKGYCFLALVMLLFLLSPGIVSAEGGNWEYILNLLNDKRIATGKDPVNVSHPEDISMEGVLAIQAGTEEILPDYGFSGLADALNCAGYPRTTWSEGFDCRGEIYYILYLMKTGRYTYANLIRSIKTHFYEQETIRFCYTQRCGLCPDEQCRYYTFSAYPAGTLVFSWPCNIPPTTISSRSE